MEESLDHVSVRITRRSLFKAAGAAALAGAAGPLARSARAQTFSMSPNGAGYYRFKVGDATITLLSDGQSIAQLLPGFAATPGRQEAFAAALRAHFIDPAAAIINFIPMVVETGRNKVLIDTGVGPGGIANGVGLTMAHLMVAGYSPSDIDTVFITHWHPDHIGGLTLANGQPAFPNARHLMGAADFNFAVGQANPAPAVRANLVPLRGRFTFLQPNQEIAPGITAVPTPGHTMGHMSVVVTSANQSLMHFGDAGGHDILSFQFPDHFAGFDADKEVVVRTRAEMFARAASTGMLVVGYHVSWPGVGRVRRDGNAYQFVPMPFRFQ
jgi:glyoxylase-like metal-dependent hydrolase (beta-lactamase superfamily II)